MARSDSLLIYGLILSTLLNTLRFTSVDKHPVGEVFFVSFLGVAQGAAQNLADVGLW